MELREELTPAGPFRLQRHSSMDGTLRHRGGVLSRLLHHGEDPVVVRVVQTAPDVVVLGARAGNRAAASHGIARMRFALGVDEDQRPFLRRFARDPLIGDSLRRRPWLRVGRRPEPFEALAWAICEQLIDYERAAAIERRVVAALGRAWVCGDPHDERLRDLPSPAALAGAAPARLQSFDLAASRALTLVRAAREVARGRVNLHDVNHEAGWRRLRAIPGVGTWTIEMLALYGQGRGEQVPAGDVGLLKQTGRVLSHGDPHARAEEWQVRELFAPYEEWSGLAATHMISL